MVALLASLLEPRTLVTILVALSAFATVLTPQSVTAMTSAHVGAHDPDGREGWGLGIGVFLFGVVIWSGAKFFFSHELGLFAATFA